MRVWRCACGFAVAAGREGGLSPRARERSVPPLERDGTRTFAPRHGLRRAPADFCRRRRRVLPSAGRLATALPLPPELRRIHGPKRFAIIAESFRLRFVNAEQGGSSPASRGGGDRRHAVPQFAPLPEVSPKDARDEILAQKTCGGRAGPGRCPRGTLRGLGGAQLFRRPEGGGRGRTAVDFLRKRQEKPVSAIKGTTLSRNLSLFSAAMSRFHAGLARTAAPAWRWVGPSRSCGSKGSWTPQCLQRMPILRFGLQEFIFWLPEPLGFGSRRPILNLSVDSCTRLSTSGCCVCAQDPFARFAGRDEVAEAFRVAVVFRGGTQVSPARVVANPENPAQLTVHLHHKYRFFTKDVVRTQA